MKVCQSYRIGRCQILPQEYAIQFSDSEKQSLQPKIIEVLNYLALHYPRIIPRDELIENIWLGNAYVGEKALTNTIWHLRQNLNAATDETDVIETIRKVGYRLLVEPEFDTEADHAHKSADESTPKPSLENKAELPAGHRHVLNNMQRTWKDFIPHYLIVLTIVFSFGYFYENSQKISAPEIEKITKAPGSELFASPSPDGRYVVYRWHKTDDSKNLYMQDTHQPELKAKQLTFDRESEKLSVWDQTGKYLFFARRGTNFCDLIKLNVTTGQEKKLTDCPAEGGYYYLDISPDNNTLAFHGHLAPAKDAGVYFLALNNDIAKPIRFSCSDNCGYRDRDMAFAPDGEHIAVSRRFNRFDENIFLVNINTKEEIQLTEGEEDIVGFTWHPSGDYLVYATQRADVRAGFILNIHNKEITKLGIEGFSYPEIAKQSGQLYYQQRKEKYYIASIQLDDKIAASPFPVIQSDYNHHYPDYSAVSKKIAYVSNESGFYELWQSDINGEEREQLTYLNKSIRYPKWSHDGTKIAFLGPAENGAGDKLYVFDTVTKKLSVVESPYNRHNHPSWSFDDSAIISSAFNVEYEDLYQFSLADGTTKRLTTDGAFYGIMISPTTLLYTKDAEYGLWQKELDENSPSTKKVSAKIFRTLYSWNYQDGGVYFRTNKNGNHHISYYDFSTKDLTPIVRLPARTFKSYGALSLIPESKTLLFTSALYPQSDIKRLSHPLLH